MEATNVIEIAKSTVDEVDRVLRLSNSDYIKEFGCEADRTDKAKIEKAVNMISTLRFFIDKYYEEQAPKVQVLNETNVIPKDVVDQVLPEKEAEVKVAKPKPVAKKKS